MLYMVFPLLYQTLHQLMLLLCDELVLVEASFSSPRPIPCGQRPVIEPFLPVDPESFSATPCDS